MRKGADVINLFTFVMINTVMSLNALQTTPTNPIITYIEESHEEQTKESKSITMYTSCKSRFRKFNSFDSETITLIPYNTKLSVTKYDNEWYLLTYDNKKGYIHNSVLSKDKCTSITKGTCKNGIKSFMPYQAITNRSSKQYKLQKMSYTGKYGIRMYDGRYLIALGSYYTHKVGQYVDLILYNGEVIECILGDCKANKHTDGLNITTKDGSLAEFIVNIGSLPRRVRISGDIGNAKDEWNSSVKAVKIYNKNVFD